MTRHELIILYALILASRPNTDVGNTNEAAVVAADHLIKLLKQQEEHDVS